MIPKTCSAPAVGHTTKPCSGNGGINADTIGWAINPSFLDPPPCEGNHPGPGATVGPQPRDDYADAGSSTPFPTRFFTGSLKAEPLSARTRVPCARRRGHHRLSGSRTAPAPDQTATRFGRPEARGGCLRYRGAAISGSWPSRTSAAARRSASSISLWEEYLAMKGCSR